MVIVRKETADAEACRLIDDMRREAFYEPPGQNVVQRWVRLECKFPVEVAHIVRDEFERIGGLLQLKPDLPDKVRWGLILEYICINSALTPIESLE